jgi:HSP20 family protein
MKQQQNLVKNENLRPANRPFSLFSPLFENEFLPSLFSTQEHTGLSVSEDENNIYVEAALPGLKQDDVQITYENGTLWIKGQREEEQKDKKRSFYKKSQASFSYHLNVPGHIDDKKEASASFKDGVVQITFSKAKEKKAKEIKINKKA